MKLFNRHRKFCVIKFKSFENTQKMATTPELSDLQKLELKEAFDEFDKVREIKKFK